MKQLTVKMSDSNSSHETADNTRAKTETDKDETNESAMGGSDVTTPTSSASKEKRSWFHSLTRRKKTQPQTANYSATTPSATAEHLQNNNNEPPSPETHSRDESASSACTGRKRKEEKNAFQRFRKKMGLHFHSLRQRRHHNEADGAVGGASGTTDASAEFLTHSPAHEPSMKPIHEQLRFSFAGDAAADGTGIEELESEMVPFTHDYKRFIVKKWLEIESPNRIMYNACSEMLSQVWYWGEISRRDAQRQLTDKPTGSFLVRDSETSGCQFTLSFRILNVTLHYRLVYHDNYWHFEELQYESVVEMIEDILYRCTNNNFVCFVRVPNEMQPPFPVILKYPLSRYLKMPHLQDLCRRVIQCHATPSEIAKLPLPSKLHEYLNEKRELVFQS